MRLTICEEARTFICAERMWIPPCYIYIHPRDSALTQPDIRPWSAALGYRGSRYRVWSSEPNSLQLFLLTNRFRCCQLIDIPCSFRSMQFSRPYRMWRESAFRHSVIHLGYLFRSQWMQLLCDDVPF